MRGLLRPLSTPYDKRLRELFTSTMSLLRDMCLRSAWSARGACGPASSSAPASALAPRHSVRSRVRVSKDMQQYSTRPVPSALPVNYSGPCWEHAVWPQPGQWSSGTLVLPEKRKVLEQSVHQYYQDVWNSGTTEVLDSLAEDGIVYSDVLGAACCDVLGRAGLRQLIGDFLAGHPLMWVTLVSYQAYLDIVLFADYSSAGSCSHVADRNCQAITLLLTCF